MRTTTETDRQYLERASTNVRREYAHELIGNILDGKGPFALTRFQDLANVVLNETHNPTFDAVESVARTHDLLPQGYFSAKDSLRILDMPRVRGFCIGLQEAQNVRRAIDIGTGSSAILAIATAVLHPEIESITAYECNKHATKCAQKIVSLCGYEDLIDITCADGFVVPVKESDLVVSETFHMALGFESGARLLNRFAEATPQILPARADIWAASILRNNPDPMREMRLVDTVDFRQLKPLVEGTVSHQPSPDRVSELKVMSLLYSQYGTELIRPGADYITQLVTLASLRNGLNGEDIPPTLHFSYRHSDGNPQASLSLRYSES